MPECCAESLNRCQAPSCCSSSRLAWRLHSRATTQLGTCTSIKRPMNQLHDWHRCPVCLQLLWALQSGLSVCMLCRCCVTPAGHQAHEDRLALNAIALTRKLLEQPACRGNTAVVKLIMWPLMLPLQQILGLSRLGSCEWHSGATDCTDCFMAAPKKALQCALMPVALPHGQLSWRSSMRTRYMLVCQIMMAGSKHQQWNVLKIALPVMQVRAASSWQQTPCSLQLGPACLLAAAAATGDKPHSCGTPTRTAWDTDVRRCMSAQVPDPSQLEQVLCSDL